MVKVMIELPEFTEKTVNRLVEEGDWLLTEMINSYLITNQDGCQWQFVYTDDEVNNDDDEVLVFLDDNSNNNTEVK